MSHPPSRLAQEQSLYLRQHAYNPVHWYPWGEEAFAEAKTRNIPVFLSIGYAACHWCHVMEQNCFEDEEVASLLNAHFISIKVDREERPDIDQIYMTVCQAMTGSGGWPLSLFLTPDKHPFYAATYIPKDSTQGNPGMLEILPYLAKTWKDKRDEVIRLSDHIVSKINQISCGYHDEKDLSYLAKSAADSLIRHYDQGYGGFGRGPKFPSVPALLFLLRHAGHSQNPDVMSMISTTLDRMAYGGVRDHLDGGFHRYATDIAWKLPHFEKMLYDQAMCALIYTEAWQVFGKEQYRTIATMALDYMIHSLSDAQGGFYSSEDADSPEGEGAYYLWSSGEFFRLFGEDAPLAAHVFGALKEGNVSRMHGMKVGDNVLYPETDPCEKLLKAGINNPEEIYASFVQVLLSARQSRQKPVTDDKVLTDWNGLAIWALTYAGMVFQTERFVHRAISAADFFVRTMIQADGSVLHRYRDSQAGIEGTAGDYIHLAWAFVMLYQATGDPKWLSRSCDLQEEATRHFYDPDAGGYYQTAEKTPLPVRLKDLTDGPVPSVNGVGYMLLRTLANITGKSLYSDKAREMEKMYSGMDPGMVVGATSFLSGYYDSLNEARAVLCGDPENRIFLEMQNMLWLCYIPGLVKIPIPLSSYQEVSGLAPGIDSRGDDPIVSLCAKNHCYPPAKTIGELKKYLQDLLIFKGNQISHSIQAPDQ